LQVSSFFVSTITGRPWADLKGSPAGPPDGILGVSGGMHQRAAPMRFRPRGSNENTNGRLCQYFAKATDRSAFPAIYADYGACAIREKTTHLSPVADDRQ
jgi:hypothetical protein